MIRFRVLEVKKKRSSGCNIGKGLNVINYQDDRIMSCSQLKRWLHNIQEIED